MAPCKSRAFILSARDYRETSRLLHVFCENEGRISLVARGLKGPKSKKAAVAEPFNLVQLTYSIRDGASMGQLTAIDAEKSWPGLRNQLDAYALASYWFEVIEHVAQARMASADLFQATEEFLRVAEQEGRLTWGLARQLIRLMHLLGFGIQLGECGLCGRRENLAHFDPTAGTIICSQCARAGSLYIPFSHSLALALSNSSVSPDHPIASSDSASIIFAINEMIAAHLEYRPRSFNFLQEIVLPGYISRQ